MHDLDNIVELGIEGISSVSSFFFGPKFSIFVMVSEAQSSITVLKPLFSQLIWSLPQEEVVKITKLM